MNSPRAVVLSLATLCAIASALRLTHNIAPQGAVVPQAIQPLEYKADFAPYINSAQILSNPPPNLPNQPLQPIQSANQLWQLGQSPSQPPIVPNSIPPLLFPANCSNGKIWSDSDLNCVCPPEKPYADRRDICISCSLNQTFNPATKMCQCKPDAYDDGGRCYSCPPPAAWDPNFKKCVRCPEGFIFDYNTSQCTCPKDKPYLDSNNLCQSCNGQWDNTTNTCKACEANFTWNPTSKKCECKGENFDDGAGKCIACPSPASWDISNKKCVRCPQGFNFNQQNSHCSCPKDKPYLDANNLCVSCSTKWDELNFACLVCKFGTAWNNSTQKCEQKCPYPLTNGQCRCPEDKPLLDYSSQQCQVCPKESPVWNGKDCKPCPANSNYIPGTKTCVSCVEGTVFNASSQSCQLSS